MIGQTIQKITPVILCGGRSLRSPDKTPKQFLPLTGGAPMMIETIRRCDDPIFTAPIISTNITYHDTVERILDAHKINPQSVIYEEDFRNTCAAIRLVCQKNTGTRMLFLPCDHDFDDFQTIIDTIKTMKLNNDLIHIFGSRYHHFDPAFGYIKPDPQGAVLSFVEKPDCPLPDHPFQNTGMVMGNGTTILQAINTHAPDDDANTTLSFDRAVLERANNLHMITVDTNWRDLGFGQIQQSA